MTVTVVLVQCGMAVSLSFDRNIRKLVLEVCEIYSVVLCPCNALVVSGTVYSQTIIAMRICCLLKISTSSSFMKKHEGLYVQCMQFVKIATSVQIARQLNYQ